MSASILPDSRAKNITVGSKMVDWPVCGGKTVRLEAVLIYCANCGKEFGWVPKDNTTFAFWLCNQCFEKYGPVVGTCCQPDEDFCQAVAAEMLERFGRALTEQEVCEKAALGQLGSALEKLEKESPFPSINQRPKG